MVSLLPSIFSDIAIGIMVVAPFTMSRKLPDEFLGTTGRPPLSNAAANDSVAAPAMARGKTVPTSFGREAAGAEGLDQGGQQAKQENVNMTQGQLRRMSVSPKGRTQKKRDRSRSPAAKPEVRVSARLSLKRAARLHYTLHYACIGIVYNWSGGHIIIVVP